MDLYYTKEEELIQRIISLGCREKINEPNISKLFGKLCMYNEELYRHSINVSILSMIIGSYVHDDIKEIKDLFVAGLLHDYGKLFIPREIINKCKGLTLKERRVVETHTTLGYLHLKKETKLNNKILSGVLEHHERIDGTGYGDKKHELNISSYAKIIMIADVYDAMISDRVYRRKIDRGIVYEYLLNNAGRHFSNELIKCFINNTVYIDLKYVVREIEGYLLGYDEEGILRVSE